MNPKVIKIITIIINGIFTVLFPLSFFSALFSPMMFDAPGSTELTYVWIMFYTVFTYPIVIIGAVVTSLVLLFRFKAYKKALIMSLLPFINIIIIFMVFAFTE